MINFSFISRSNATTFPTFPSQLRTVATHFLYFLYQRLPFPLISPPFPHRCYIFPSFPVPSLPHFQPFCPFAHRCYIFPQFLAPSLPHFRPFLPFCAPMLHISAISRTIAVYCASGRTTASTVHLSEPSANIIATLSPAFLPRAPFSTTPSASVARTYPL